MTKKSDTIDKVIRLGESIHEAKLCMTILQYARSGHASKLMIEQALELVEKNIALQRMDGASAHSLKTAEDMKRGLEAALIAGIQSLRMPKLPGPEYYFVEEPLFRIRTALGHSIRRQVKCDGGFADLVDQSISQLVECKYLGTNSSLGEAAAQLQRYSPSFPGLTPVIAVLRIRADAQWLADVLRREGFTILELKKDA